jgi:hypothetical protein
LVSGFAACEPALINARAPHIVWVLVKRAYVVDAKMGIRQCECGAFGAAIDSQRRGLAQNEGYAKRGSERLESRCLPYQVTKQWASVGTTNDDLKLLGVWSLAD